jgi:hypothetical protein
MTSADTLEQLAASTLATTNWATTFLQGGGFGQARPLGETASALVETLHRLLATLTPERLQRLDYQTATIAARTLGPTQSYLHQFLTTAAQSGHDSESWFGAMSELLDQLDNVLEGLYLSLDEDFRQLVGSAITELAAVSGAAPADWRSSLAKMPD